MDAAEDTHHGAGSEARLIYMANQIARFFASQKHDAAAAGVADHIAHFWDPRMRARIRAHLAAGGEGLDPLAREGIAALKH
jgi:formate dehydrogenase subunit delta